MANKDSVPGGTAHTGEQEVEKHQPSAPRKPKLVRLTHRHNWSTSIVLERVTYHFAANGHQDVPTEAVNDPNFIQARDGFSVTEVPRNAT